jgi:hypothetical protein
MRRYLIFTLLLLISNFSYARNVNGNIQIVNQSKYPLINIEQRSNKMLVWNFPYTIAPFAPVIVPVQYDAPMFTLGFSEDNSGQTSYQVICDDGQIENINIKFGLYNSWWFVGGFTPNFTVTKDGANCVNTQPSEDIGWKRDGIVTLTINSSN